jgi:hypothetical protein
MNKPTTIQFYNRSNCIDSINELINEYNPNSYKDFQRKVPPEMKIQLLKQLGTQMKQLATQLIKIKLVTEKCKIRQQNCIELINNITIRKEDKENINWLENLLIINGINIKLFTEFMLIQLKFYKKINTFIIKGSTNRKINDTMTTSGTNETNNYLQR